MGFTIQSVLTMISTDDDAVGYRVIERVKRDCGQSMSAELISSTIFSSRVYITQVYIDVFSSVQFVFIKVCN